MSKTSEGPLSKSEYFSTYKLRIDFYLLPLTFFFLLTARGFMLLLLFLSKSIIVFTFKSFCASISLSSQFLIEPHCWNFFPSVFSSSRASSFLSFFIFRELILADLSALCLIFSNFSLQIFINFFLQKSGIYEARQRSTNDTIMFFHICQLVHFITNYFCNHSQN